MGKVPHSLRRRSVLCSLALAAMMTWSMAAQAQGTLQRVRSEGKITVGIHNGAPWGYLGQDGKVTGFSPDLVRAAFEPLGVNTVDFVVADFGALIPGLVAQRFDAVASGLYITSERCKSVAFSDPDLSLRDAIIVKAGNPRRIHSYADIAKSADISIGISRGSANVQNALSAGVPNSKIQLYANTETTIAALIGGRVDAISFSAPTVISILARPNITGLERAAPFQGYLRETGLEAAGYSAIAFRPTDTDLRDAYNKRLVEMKADATLAAIMKKYGFTEAETAPKLSQAEICAGGG
ncbi:MAG: ectoine/hydroxyectoine ABC transporter substrate-binding protein EhuB [Proteobacteria bacterium]|nr:ectoine/hydroxyectoine ABC transporter substrate-binding protein EhuB [Pseudomonadota bacterium]